MTAPVTLTGRLGADPELSFAPSGTAVAKLRVVTDRRVRENDEWKSVDTTWWNVTAFKALAEGAAEELRKGDLVVVVGAVKSREYETREGEKRTAWEVIANHIGRDLSRPRRGEGGSSSPLGSDPWANAAPTNSTEIPF